MKRKMTMEEFMQIGGAMPKTCIVVDKHTGKQTRRKTDTVIRQMRENCVVEVVDYERTSILMADLHCEDSFARVWIY